MKTRQRGRRVELVLQDISTVTLCGCNDINYIVNTLRGLGQIIQGFCFVWITTSGTGKVEIVGIAPVFIIGNGNDQVAFVAGTWFSAHLRGTRTHTPSIDARVLQIYFEGMIQMNRVIFAPGINGDWETKVLPLGLRAITTNEIWSLPDVLRQLARMSLPNCKHTPTGLYCVDEIALPMIGARFMQYALRPSTGFRIRDMYDEVNFDSNISIVRHRVWEQV